VRLSRIVMERVVRVVFLGKLFLGFCFASLARSAYDFRLLIISFSSSILSCCSREHSDRDRAGAFAPQCLPLGLLLGLYAGSISRLLILVVVDPCCRHELQVVAADGSSASASSSTVAAEPLPLRVGARVRVVLPAGRDQPAYRWGSHVNAESIGTLRSLSGTEARVDFPGVRGWMALASELQVVAADAARWAPV
jgi:hypothetical protein